jgi:hypothetical protein
MRWAGLKAAVVQSSSKEAQHNPKTDDLLDPPSSSSCFKEEKKKKRRRLDRFGVCLSGFVFFKHWTHPPSTKPYVVRFNYQRGTTTVMRDYVDLTPRSL